MSYRLLAAAATVAALSVMQISTAAAQSVYVAPGGIYIGAGAGPVYLSSGAPLNGSGYGYGAAAAYVAPPYGYDYGYGAAAYVQPGYDDAYQAYGYQAATYAQPGCHCGYGAAAYVEPGYGYYGSAPGVYMAPRYGYAYGPRPYIRPGYRYGYGPAITHGRYYGGARAAYAAALPLRPRVSVPYRSGRVFHR